MAEKKFSYENLDAETNDLLVKYFTTPLRTGYIKCKGCVLPEYFKEYGDRIRKMEIRDDDIWVCTFPKTGTTWTQEMIWCIGHNVDLETANELIFTRFPFFEFSSLFDHRQFIKENPEITLHPRNLDSVNYVNELPSPRFIKTHLPFDLLPEKLQNFSIRAKDLKSVIYKTADFMEKSISENDVEKLLDHLSFSSMKKNRAVNYEPAVEMGKEYKFIDEEGSFMRKGEIGDWQGMMDSVLCERFEKWEKENLNETDFTFYI